MIKITIGVDEAGRGPLAGPITLAVFAASQNLREKLIKILGGKIKDSKQFSEKRREEIYKKFLILRRENKVSFFVSHISNKIIDNRGISEATRRGIRNLLPTRAQKCTDIFLLKNSSCSRQSRSQGIFDSRASANFFTIPVRLDGLLKAPEKFKNQKTIIGGDSKNIFIACASIVAKVRRDRLMRRLAKKYPRYSLEIHKGYGTALHYKLLKKHGLSEIHRKSFLKNLTKVTK